MTPQPPIYRLSRCRKDDTLYGRVHASSDGDTTLCGQVTGENWWVVGNDATGEVTCPRCRKAVDLPFNLC